jgi:hypothetical protein
MIQIFLKIWDKQVHKMVITQKYNIIMVMIAAGALQLMVPGNHLGCYNTLVAHCSLDIDD